jgi:hypothetical protein
VPTGLHGSGRMTEGRMAGEPVPFWHGVMSWLFWSSPGVLCVCVALCVCVVLLCCGFLSRFLLLNGMKRSSPTFSRKKA